MKITIITQTEEVVNYDNILKISMIEAMYGDVNVYAVVAVPNGTAVNEDDPEKLVQLGIYTSENKCREVYGELLHQFRRGVDTVFDMPTDAEE